MTTQATQSPATQPQSASARERITTEGWPRVLLFTDSDAFAGTERHMLDLASELPGRGIGVGIACPVPSPLADRAREMDIPVTAIAKQGSIDRAAIKSLRQLLKDDRVDVIHSHNGRTALIASVAVRLARKGRCVATQHFISPSRTNRRGLKGFVGRRIHGWVSGHTHRFIAISRAVERGMVERGEGSAASIAIIPNGIADRPTQGDVSREEMRRKLGLVADAPLVFSATRLVPEKDVESLIKAMAMLRAEHPLARCVIAGEGALQDDLKKKIEELGVSESVQLLGFRNDVATLMSIADVFVLPAISEPFGLVLLEAMSKACPVIATASGGPLEIIEQGVTGFLVEPQSAQSLAHAIDQMLSDPISAHRMGQKGRARFEQQFTAKRMATLTASVYVDAVSKI